MEFVAHRALEIPNKYCGRKCVPLLLSNHLISVLENNKTIGVVNISDSHYTRRHEDHASPVTALCTSQSGGKFFCSCSHDKVILWDTVEACQQSADPPSHVVAGIDLGPIEHCALSVSNKWLALCQWKQIVIICLEFSGNGKGIKDLRSVYEHTVLSCGNSVFHSSAFSPTQLDILVALEHNAFKVWDVESSVLLYQSLSFGVRAVLTCGAFDAISGQMVLGSNLGQAHVFHVDPGSTRKVMEVDAAGIFEHAAAARNQDGENMNDDVESGCMVLSAQLFNSDLQATSPEGQHLFQQDCTTLNSILATGPRLVVCCNIGITVFDCKTTDCLAHLVFSATELLPGISLGLVDLLVIYGQSTDRLQFVVRDTLRSVRVHVVSLELRRCKQEVSLPGVAVVPSVPVCMNSPLKRVWQCAKVSTYALQSSRSNRTVKSSGYGKPQPPHVMFSPSINLPTKLKKSNSSTGYTLTRKTLPNVSGLLSSESDVMRCCGPPTKMLEKVSVSDATGTISSLAASGDGKRLACSWTTSICILSFNKFDVEKSINFSGHDKIINSLRFNLNSTWLISSSNDGTAKVWDWKNKKCVLNIDSTSKYPPVNSKSQQKSTLLGGEILDAQFSYMDQFILLSSGNSLHLLNHSLHEPGNGPHKWSSVYSAAVPAQQITCISAANQLHSYLVISGCSNKSIVVHDLNVQRCCAVLNDVHSRPPHRLRQLGGTHAAAMHDLFVTAAVTDGAKLWDLRAARSVAKYSRHCCRTYGTGLDVSPCGRFLAVGSEDRATYIYDTRKASDYVSKLVGLGDVVVEVAFNPSHPVMASAALNGSIAKYTS